MSLCHVKLHQVYANQSPPGPAEVGGTQWKPGGPQQRTSDCVVRLCFCFGAQMSCGWNHFWLSVFLFFRGTCHFHCCHFSRCGERFASSGSKENVLRCGIRQRSFFSKEIQCPPPKCSKDDEKSSQFGETHIFHTWAWTEKLQQPTIFPQNST